MDKLITAWRMLDNLQNWLTAIFTAVAFSVCFLGGLWSLGQWARQRWPRWFLFPPGGVALFFLMAWWWGTVMPRMFGYQSGWGPKYNVQTPHSEVEKAEIKHFQQSMRYSNQVIQLLNDTLREDRLVTTDKATLGRIMDLNARALIEAERVSDKTLAKLHPELPRHFREEYCKGLVLKAKSHATGDTEACIKYQALDEEFADWYDAHLDELRRAMR